MTEESFRLADEARFGRLLDGMARRIAAAAGADRVRAAVLCSRGENEVPVTAAVAGLQLDVGEAGVVEVHVPPYEETPGIHLVRRPD